MAILIERLVSFPGIQAQSPLASIKAECLASLLGVAYGTQVICFGDRRGQHGEISFVIAGGVAMSAVIVNEAGQSSDLVSAVVLVGVVIHFLPSTPVVLGHAANLVSILRITCCSVGW
jgi:hypothetical protein